MPKLTHARAAPLDLLDADAMSALVRYTRIEATNKKIVRPLVAELTFQAFDGFEDTYGVYWHGTSHESLRRRNFTREVEWTPAGWRRAGAETEPVVATF